MSASKLDQPASRESGSAASASEPQTDVSDESTRKVEEQASQQGTSDLSAVADLGTPESGPKQVHLPQYPLSQFGAQQRVFNKNWFQQFKWLEYSVSRNSTFCFSCRLYGRQNIRNNKDALLSESGF